MTTPSIRVTGLSVGWNGSVLLHNLDFEVARGERFVILGGSGCGKSTLLRFLIGLETPIEGRVELDGEPLQLEVGKPRFGVMLQSGALLGSLTVGQNVALPLRAWTTLSRSAIAEVVAKKLHMVGLEGTEDRLPSELSGGMRKRASIARAMALEPTLMFFDEPSAGLDPVMSAQVDELLLTLNEDLGITLVVVTHDLASILAIGQRCIMLDKDEKGILAQGAPRELRDHDGDPRVQAFFRRHAQVHP